MEGIQVHNLFKIFNIFPSLLLIYALFVFIIISETTDVSWSEKFMYL